MEKPSSWPAGGLAMSRWHRWAWLVGLAGCATGGSVTPGSSTDGIVVVCLDTLRADRLGVLGHPGGLTPNLDRLASEGVLFRQAHAQANETVLSHASLFTGTEASAWGSFDADYRLPQGARTVAGRFHAAGWQTGAVVAGGHMSTAFGLDAGFSHYDDDLEWGSLMDTGPRALRWLDQRNTDQSFFLFVHAYDTHDRYLKPSPFGYSHASRDHQGLGRDLGRSTGAVSQIADGAWLGTGTILERFAVERERFQKGRGAAQEPGAVPLTSDDLAHLAGLYDGSVAWADAAFGLLMADLDERGLLDTAWVVVLADHGHALGEEGFFHHRFDLSDETLHVPLIIRPPGGLGAAVEVDGLVELLDVAPSLLDIAGIPGDDMLQGQSLWDGGWRAPGHSVVRAEGRLRLLSVRSETARLVSEGVAADAADGVERLAAGRIDGEALRVTGDPNEAAALQSALVEWRRALSARGTP